MIRKSTAILQWRRQNAKNATVSKIRSVKELTARSILLVSAPKDSSETVIDHGWLYTNQRPSDLPASSFP
jgi:hypothetical protein